MTSRRFYRIMTPVLATLTVVVSMFWAGPTMSGKQTVMVYKNPT